MRPDTLGVIGLGAIGGARDADLFMKRIDHELELDVNVLARPRADFLQGVSEALQGCDDVALGDAAALAARTYQPVGWRTT